MEGKELSELNTYLICRAFWREDKTKSQVCNNTKNPFYQFCQVNISVYSVLISLMYICVCVCIHINFTFQLVPLIYDSDLLKRIKDNYIIIEVYSRNNNIDNLLGLTKLSVHQLYVAYRDPRVLPYLLLSKVCHFKLV